MYYLCSENKGADKLRGYHEVFVFAQAFCLFSYAEAHILSLAQIDSILNYEVTPVKYVPVTFSPIYPLTPHFNIVKTGCAGVYTFLAHLSRRLTGELIG